MKISITELPEYEVAYIRRVGSYFEPQEHWGQLLYWAASNDLFPPEQHYIGISLDDPASVESSHCRHDACVTIPEGFGKEAHEDVQFKKLGGGLYALCPFYDTPDKLNQAYQHMFGQWLPESGYNMDTSRYNLEFNMNNPAEDPEGKCKVDLYVPLKEQHT
ncbi:MAG TPA: GyrI-like domain-containing protein [Bacillaceae bacterium]